MRKFIDIFILILFAVGSWLLTQWLYNVGVIDILVPLVGFLALLGAPPLEIDR